MLLRLYSSTSTPSNLRGARRALFNGLARNLSSPRISWNVVVLPSSRSQVSSTRPPSRCPSGYTPMNLLHRCLGLPTVVVGLQLDAKFSSSIRVSSGFLLEHQYWFSSLVETNSLLLVTSIRKERLLRLWTASRITTGG